MNMMLASENEMQVTILRLQKLVAFPHVLKFVTAAMLLAARYYSR